VQYVKDDKFLKLLGNRIRELRKQRKITQVELAVLCNNYAEQIGRIERGELNVSVCTLRVIAKALNITLSELTNLEQ
jgi:transcriptional regulator with XRE-family HTH domain